ncbi:hypothetical protein [Corynebacterium sp. 335C]
MTGRTNEQTTTGRGRGGTGGTGLPGLVRDTDTGLYVGGRQPNQRRLKTAIARDELIRVLRGIYAPTPDGPLDRKRLFEARALGAGLRRPSDVVTGPAAAAILGLDFLLPTDNVVDVIAPRTAGLERAGLIHRRSRELAEEEIVVKHGVRVTAPARTIVETALLHGGRGGFCVAESALRGGQVRRDELDAALERCTRRKRLRDARRAVDLAGDRSGSIGESLTKWGCADDGLPAPMQQITIRDERELFVGVVDFFWPDAGLVVEFDGDVKTSGAYGNPVAVARKQISRHDDLTHTGLHVQRVTWAEAFHGTAFPVIRRLLEKRAGRGRDFTGTWVDEGM